MPFNFITMNIYQVNYFELFEKLNFHPILSDKKLQAEYLKMWMSVLIEHDKILEKQLKDTNAMIDLVQKMSLEPETFQFPITYNTVEVFIHFRVYVANKILSNHKKNVITIPTSEFVDTNSNIFWTPVSDTELIMRKNTLVERLKNNDPVIIIPFYNNKHSYLVIDGNHRLTYATAKNQLDEIKVFMLAEESVIDLNLLSSSFDKYFYIMHNELNHIGELTSQKELSAMEIVKKSFLSDGRFKFRNSI